MKKKLMTILLLAAAFVLALTPVLAQEGDEIEASVLPAEGWVADGLAGTVWQDDRASLEIMFNEGSGLTVFIMWASSAWEHTEEDRLVIRNAADESLEGKIFTPIGYDAGEAVG